MPFDVELVYDDRASSIRKWKVTPDNGESFFVMAHSKMQAIEEAQRRLTKERPWR